MASTRLRNMSATEVFKQQVKASMDSIKLSNASSTAAFYPQQLGGVFMQREIMESGSVMRIISLKEAGQ